MFVLSIIIIGLVHIVSAVLKVPTRAENDTVYNYITSGNSSLFFAAGLLVTDVRIIVSLELF